MLAGLAQVLPKNVWQYVVQIPRLAALGSKFVLQGGTQYNLAAVKAQVDYIKERVPDARGVRAPAHGRGGRHRRGDGDAPRRQAQGHVDASSASMPRSTSSTRRRTTTRPSATSARTSASARSSTPKRPDGSTSRYIAGFSCEKGTVESKEAMLSLVAERKKIAQRVPEPRRLRGASGVPALLRRRADARGGLAHQRRRGAEGLLRRAPRRGQAALPALEQGAWDDAAQRAHRHPARAQPLLDRPLLPDLLRGASASRSRTSSSATRRPRRCGSRAASTARSTPATRARSRRRTSTTCSSTRTPEKKPLKYIFFPILTHVNNFVADTMDNASCPIVAGAPDVMKAAFTKEVDFFATRGIEYLDPAVSFVEPTLMARRLFETFGPRLGITEDENDFAVQGGVEGARRLRHGRRGEGPRDPRDGRGGGPRRHPHDRPPVPLRPGPQPRHPRGVPGPRLPDPLRALDPEGPRVPRPLLQGGAREGHHQERRSSSTTCGRRTTRSTARRRCGRRASRRTTRTSSCSISRRFKCGHDAPTYGLIDSIIETSKTPYAALHDIDANKPGGSIKIRVKTYAHALKLHEERLQDARKRNGRARPRARQEAPRAPRARAADAARPRDTSRRRAPPSSAQHRGARTRRLAAPTRRRDRSHRSRAAEGQARPARQERPPTGTLVPHKSRRRSRRSSTPTASAWTRRSGLTQVHGRCAMHDHRRSNSDEDSALPDRRHRRRAQEVRGGGAQAPRPRRARPSTGSRTWRTSPSRRRRRRRSRSSSAA